MVDERLPSVSVGAAAVRGGPAGPLGRRLVGGVRGGRGWREELVGEDGGGPLATDYRRHGAAAHPRRRRRLVEPPQPIPAAAVALFPAVAGHGIDASPPPHSIHGWGVDRRSPNLRPIDLRAACPGCRSACDEPRRP
jgi:hypothetical protein|uniref:Uncharacterized protein n=1 Tax=Zea mays TaxID=4577 RepID=A0A804UJC2_MAIZE